MPPQGTDPRETNPCVHKILHKQGGMMHGSHSVETTQCPAATNGGMRGGAATGPHSPPPGHDPDTDNTEAPCKHVLSETPAPKALMLYDPRDMKLPEWAGLQGQEAHECYQRPGAWRMVAEGCSVPFRGDKNVLKLVVMVCAHLCVQTRNHGQYTYVDELGGP